MLYCHACYLIPAVPVLILPCRIVKLVRAIRKGWLKTSAQKEEAKAPEVGMGIGWGRWRQR
jgi:hypothetical protein